MYYDCGVKLELLCFEKDRNTFIVVFCCRVRVVGLDNLRDVSNYDEVYVQMGMYHGDQLLCPKQTSLTTHARTYPRWNEWFIFDITVKNIPKVMTL